MYSSSLIAFKEQGKEEKNAEDIVKRYKLFGNDADRLYAGLGAC